MNLSLYTRVMEIPKVDTFEQDIANEIRQKEASLEDIASASGTIGNDADDIPKKNQSALISIITILALCGLTGAGYVGYLYYSDKTSTVTLESTTAEQKKKSSLAVNSLFPKLDQRLNRSLGTVEKTTAGYIIEIKEYSPVFSYMIRNESEFADELGEAIGNKRIIKAVSTTPSQTEQATIQATTSTSTLTTSTSTQGTTTVQTQTEEQIIPEEYIFSDITISNQNMRIATSAKGTLVYAFIGTKNLAVSSSTNGILALRSKVLQK